MKADTSFLSERSEADERIHVSAGRGLVSVRITADDDDALTVVIDVNSAKRIAAKLYASASKAETNAPRKGTH